MLSDESMRLQSTAFELLRNHKSLAHTLVKRLSKISLSTTGGELFVITGKKGDLKINPLVTNIEQCNDKFQKSCDRIRRLVNTLHLEVYSAKERSGRLSSRWQWAHWTLEAFAAICGAGGLVTNFMPGVGSIAQACFSVSKFLLTIPAKTAREVSKGKDFRALK